jgi:hypothetical protein
MVVLVVVVDSIVDSIFDNCVYEIFVASVAQFEMASQEFTGMLDGYGKLQRFELHEGRMCFQARMMDTQFYNASIAAQKIVPTMLFEPSVPDNHYTGPEILMVRRFL